MKKVYVFLIFVVVALVGYANVLNGPFLLDDEHFIQRNTHVHELNVKKIYTTSVTHGAGQKSNFYRPNQQLAFAVVYNFFKENTLPYHIVSLLVHIFNVYILFLFLCFFFSDKAAFYSSLIFLIHPIQTESVSFISGLAGPLGFFFLLSSLYLWTSSVGVKKNFDKLKLFICSILLFILSLFSKESMVVLLPMIVVVATYLWGSLENKNKKYVACSVFVFGLITFGYLFLKFNYLSFTGRFGLAIDTNVYTQNFYVRIFTFLSILWDYFLMVIAPFRLNYEKSYTAYVTLFTLRGGFGVVCLLGSLIIFIRRKKHNLLFLGCFLFWSALLPFMGIIPLNSMFLEHWLYVPFIGIIVCVASFIEFVQIKIKTKYLLMIFIVVSMLCCWRTILRNNQWNDVERFYLNELKYEPKVVRVNNNLGMYYAEQKKYQKAIFYYKNAIKYGLPSPEPYYNLANIYLTSGKVNDAVRELEKSLRIDPSFGYSINLLRQLKKWRI